MRRELSARGAVILCAFNFIFAVVNYATAIIIKRGALPRDPYYFMFNKGGTPDTRLIIKRRARGKPNAGASTAKKVSVAQAPPFRSDYALRNTTILCSFQRQGKRRRLACKLCAGKKSA